MNCGGRGGCKYFSFRWDTTKGTSIEKKKKMSRREVLPKANVYTKYATSDVFGESELNETAVLQQSWINAKEQAPDVKITSQFVRLEKRGIIRDPRVIDRTQLQRKDVLSEARAVFGVRGAKMTGQGSFVQTRIDR